MWWLLLVPLTLSLYLYGGQLYNILKVATNAFMIKAREFEGYGVIKRNGELGEVVYFDGDKTYTIIFPLPRGPCKYYRVTSNIGDDIEDVTEIIRNYSGPGHNFHSIETTPVMLGYPSLTFYTLKGEKTFYDEDTIDL